jgi:hypothetical protein
MLKDAEKNHKRLVQNIHLATVTISFVGHNILIVFSADMKTTVYGTTVFDMYDTNVKHLHIYIENSPLYVIDKICAGIETAPFKKSATAIENTKIFVDRPKSFLF